MPHSKKGVILNDKYDEGYIFYHDENQYNMFHPAPKYKNLHDRVKDSVDFLQKEKSIFSAMPTSIFYNCSLSFFYFLEFLLDRYEKHKISHYSYAKIPSDDNKKPDIVYFSEENYHNDFN